MTLLEMTHRKDCNQPLKKESHALCITKDLALEALFHLSFTWKYGKSGLGRHGGLDMMK